jgi:hypothetical protein
LLEIQKKHQILSFLDTKIKSAEEDPDRQWITTWNHLKYFFRWLYNIHENNNDSKNNYQNGGIDNNVITTAYPLSSYEDWQTPSFIQIKKKKIKRTSPYLETELWEETNFYLL